MSIKILLFEHMRYIHYTINMTNLVYLSNSGVYKSEAKVLETGEINGQNFIVLNQTIFYVQGGGQPSDIGKIYNFNGVFTVNKVILNDQNVYHLGRYESGEIGIEQVVNLEINVEKRILHSRLHSAGHIIDLAMQKLYPKMISGKGYHYPEGAYVEYSYSEENTEMATEIDSQEIEAETKKIIDLNLDISFKIENELHSSGKPNRIMQIPGFKDCFCGGTHVSKLGQIGRITIRKITMKKGLARVSYLVD